MNKLRTILATVSVVFLMGGYFGSQFIRLAGPPEEMGVRNANFVSSLDKSNVPLLSLVLLIGAIAFAFIPSKSEVSE